MVKIKVFKSEALAKGASLKENLETLSMVLVDYNYPYDKDRQGNEALPPFELDNAYYAKSIEAAGWEVRVPYERLGHHVMLIYVDVYGNEYTEVKALSDFIAVPNEASHTNYADSVGDAADAVGVRDAVEEAGEEAGVVSNRRKQVVGSEAGEPPAEGKDANYANDPRYVV